MAGYRNALAALLVLVMLVSAWPAQGMDTDGTDAGPLERYEDLSPEAPIAGDGYFTENMGQWPSHVLFSADTPFGRVWFGEEGAMYDVRTDGGGHALEVSFAADGPSRPMGLDMIGTRTNYFLGSESDGWVSGVRSFREVVYENVWDDIDVRYRFAGKALKYDVIVGPDGDPADIRFDLDGHQGLEVSGDHMDIILSEGLALRDRDLYAYHIDGGVVSASFDPSPDSYGFRVARTPGRTLVIDPVVVHSSTLLGGTYIDEINDVKVDDDGDVYVAGYTASADLPVTPGAYKAEIGSSDLFVAKMSYNLSEVLWCTFVGGSSGDFFSGMDLDDRGNVYISGFTWSWDFPVTKQAFQQEFNLGMNRNQQDMWVTKLAPDGTRLVYSTYVGGSGPDSGGEIQVRGGKAAMVGYTDSKDFPTNGGSFGAHHGDAIMWVMAANGSSMEDFVHWGGGGGERAACVAWTVDGDIVVGGYTTSVELLTTPGVFQEQKVGFCSGFVSRYSPDDDAIVWTTFLGGTHDEVSAITVDEDGNVYVAGSSLWTGPGVSFPLTPGAYDIEYNGRSEGFVCKLDPNATRLEFSTLLGGDDDDYMNDIEVMDNGSVVVAGHMENGGNFSVTKGCLDPTWDGETEGFVTVLEPNGTSALYSSFIGGRYGDEVHEVEVTPWDNLVISGVTHSKDFALSDGAFQTDLGGDGDGFVTIIGDAHPPGPPEDLVATGRDGLIDLMWRPPEDDGGYPVMRYLVFRGTAKDRLHMHAVLGDENLYLDKDVEYGVRYHYAVQADNFKGRSPLSNMASNLSFTFPDTPVNLTGIAGMDGISLRWEDPAFTGGLGLIGYRIDRGLPGEEPEPYLMTVPGDREFDDTSVVDRTTYVYQVAAVNAYGESRVRASITIRALGPPSAPEDLTHTHGDLFVRLKWQPPEEDYDLPVTGYNVYRTTFDGPSELVATATTRWYMDEDVEVGVLYYYRVTAVNAKGEGDLSEEIEVRVTVRPWPPEAVEATAHQDFVRVTWSPPGFDGATPVLEYRVYHGTTCVGVVSASTDLAFLHDVPYDGVSREYHVTAVNAEGESAPSGIAATRAFEVPGAPRDLDIEWDVGVITLDWAPPVSDGGTPITGFILYRRVGSANGWVPFSTLPGDLPYQVDTTVVNGVEYHYRVTATNLVGEGEPSAEVSAMPVGPPGPPIGVSATGFNGSVRVTWESPGDTGGLSLDGYQVYRVGDGMEAELYATVASDTLEMYVTGLENGASYLFAVAAYHMYWVSDLSDVVEARPTGPPGEPAGLVALWIVDHVYLSWSAPLDDGGSPVSGYRIRRDDWEAGRWIDLDALDMSLVDTAVERGTTYNYTVRAENAVNGGPSVTVKFTVPEEPEAPPGTTEPDNRPMMVLGVAMAVAIGVAVYGARRQKGGGDR